MIVLDTCALVWWTLGFPEKLSKRAALACQQITETGGLLPSSAIWEVGVKARKGLLDLGGYSLDEYVELLKKIPNFEIVAIDADLWVSSLDLVWDHRDPMDRLVVALAKKRSLPLLTRDAAIASFYKNTVW